MSKHFKKLNGLLTGMERNTSESIDKDCPPQFVGIAQLYRGAFLSHIIMADLMREWMNGGDRQEVLLHLAGLHNTFVFFEDGIDYEEHDLDRNGEVIPIKAETAFEQFLDLNKAFGEMNYAKAWMMRLGLQELLGFTVGDIVEMWGSPRWKQYGHGIAITPTLEAIAQAKRIEELEKTDAVRSIITLYDAGCINGGEVYDTLDGYFTKVVKYPLDQHLETVWSIYSNWEEEYHMNRAPDETEFIDQLRTVIGMSKPEGEQVNV